MAAGENDLGQCNVDEWRDIVAVFCREWETIGLRSDGTVAVTGYSSKYGEVDVDSWRNIVDIEHEYDTNYKIGLCSDGTIIETGDDHDFDKWTDIVRIRIIDVSGYYIIGLRSDGTVVVRYYDDASKSYVQRDIEGLKLFESVEQLDREMTERIQKGEKRREELAEKDRKERELKRQQEEKERELKRQQEEEERRRIEAENAAKAAELEAQISALQNELANLKGLFTGKRRKELVSQITRLKEQIKALS